MIVDDEAIEKTGLTEDLIVEGFFSTKHCLDGCFNFRGFWFSVDKSNPEYRISYLCEVGEMKI